MSVEMLLWFCDLRDNVSHSCYICICTQTWNIEFTDCLYTKALVNVSSGSCFQCACLAQKYDFLQIQIDGWCTVLNLSSQMCVCVCVRARVRTCTHLSVFLKTGSLYYKALAVLELNVQIRKASSSWGSPCLLPSQWWDQRCCTPIPGFKYICVTNKMMKVGPFLPPCWHR